MRARTWSALDRRLWTPARAREAGRRIVGLASPAELAHVPADTPYMFALLDPPSEAVRNKIFSYLDARMATALDEAATIPESTRAGLEPALRVGLALADQMRGTDPTKWWENLGFAHNGRWVFYGLGVWPVLRVAVADPARLRGVVGHLLEVAGVSIKEQTFAGSSYWISGSKGYSFIGAILDHEAVVTVLPTRAVERSLPLILGKQDAKPSLRDASTIPTLLDRHHFVRSMFGYIDTRRIVDILTSRDELAPKVDEVLGSDCRADLERLSALAPYVSFGYHHLDLAGFLASIVVDAPPPVVKALAGIRTTVPALSGAPSPMLALEAAIDLDAALDVVRAAAHQIHDHPFTCAPLRGLDDAADALSAKLDRPIPSELHGLRGFAMVLDDATISPPSYIGHAVVIGDGVAVGLGRLLRSVPGIPATQIAPDGRAVEFPVDRLHIPGLVSAHVAMRAGRAAIAFGEDSARGVVAALAKPDAPHPALVTLVWDVGRFAARFPRLFAGASASQMAAFSTITMSFDARPEGLVLDFGGSWMSATQLGR